MNLRLLVLFALLTGTIAADETSHGFPPPDELPAQNGLPDPFLKPDESRVQTEDEWPAQRAYLKEMLAQPEALDLSLPCPPAADPTRRSTRGDPQAQSRRSERGL